MNQFPVLETLEIYDSVIDDVIANMSGAFQNEGVDESTLQQLKQLWRSKVQKSLKEDPTMDTESADTKSADTKSADTTKKDGPPKEESVVVQQALAQVTNKFAEAVAVTGAVQLGIKWKLHEIEMPKGERSPLGRRVNMALGNAMQLDGGLPPIKEESSDEEDDEVNDEEAEASRPRGDDESLNSNDDLSGEEAEDDLFESDNVIACQYNKVSHFRERWKFELCNGVMQLNGKDYVFKQLTGEADF